MRIRELTLRNVEQHREAKARGDTTAMAAARQRAQHFAESEAEYAGMARFLFRRAGLL